MLETPFGQAYICINHKPVPYHAQTLPLNQGGFCVDGRYHLLIPIDAGTQRVSCGIRVPPGLALDTGPETGEDLASLSMDDGLHTVLHIGGLHEDNAAQMGMLDDYQAHDLTFHLPPHHGFDKIVFQIAWRHYPGPIDADDVSTWLACDPSLSGWYYQQGRLSQRVAPPQA